jgi:uracil-DNA glycosylase
MQLQNIKQELLNDLFNFYRQHPFAPCRLCKNSHKQLVTGRGDPDARIMFIGEAPGQEEDLQGRPFVGRSGKLLTHVLKKLGIDEAKDPVFITNIVKCRPPDNRKPTPEESAFYKKLFLIPEIKIVQPQLLCTLGATALEGLIETPVRMTTMRGKIFRYNNIPLLPTYHPAYVLRNPSVINDFSSDIQTALKNSGLLA